MRRDRGRKSDEQELAEAMIRNVQRSRGMGSAEQNPAAAERRAETYIADLYAYARNASENDIDDWDDPDVLVDDAVDRRETQQGGHREPKLAGITCLGFAKLLGENVPEWLSPNEPLTPDVVRDFCLLDEGGLGGLDHLSPALQRAVARFAGQRSGQYVELHWLPRGTSHGKPPRIFAEWRPFDRVGEEKVRALFNRKKKAIYLLRTVDDFIVDKTLTTLPRMQPSEDNVNKVMDALNKKRRAATRATLDKSETAEFEAIGMAFKMLRRSEADVLMGRLSRKQKSEEASWPTLTKEFDLDGVQLTKEIFKVALNEFLNEYKRALEVTADGQI